MIQVVGLRHNFGERDLFRGISWTVGDRDRVALVGLNGSGKSTLMKIIAGLMEPEEGQVTFGRGTTFGYLPQDGVVHHGRSVLEEVKTAFGEIVRLEQRQKELEKALAREPEATEAHTRAAMELAEVQHEFMERGGHGIGGDIERVLTGLGFKREELHQNCEAFSGGWQMRVALAKILLTHPTLLLLDEPTNYLDIEARTWLMQFLRDYDGAVLLVSHDRYFIDQVVTKITEIHNGQLDDYFTNYSGYLEEREKRLEILRVQYVRQQEEIARIEAFINRFRYKADKASLVQSRVKQLEKIKRIELPTFRKKIRFRFPEPEPSGKDVLIAEELAAAYDEKVVFEGMDFLVRRGEKVAVAGVNGAGKTTLLRLISHRKTPQRGELRLGHNVTLDYFAQDVERSLDPKATVYQTLEREAPYAMVPRLRDMLGAFLFSGDDVEKPVSVLSGGERNRLALCRMLLKPSNLLVLDEPTNHLDIDAKDVLLDALKTFPGTVLFVSHDRYFLDNLAERVFFLDHGTFHDYPGRYPEFLEYIEGRETKVDIREAKEEARKQKAKQRTKEERIRLREIEKQRQRDIRNRERKLEKLEEDIANLEQAQQVLLARMADPKMATDFTELERLVDEKEVIDRRIEGMYEEYSALDKELSEFRAEQDES